MHAFIGRRCPGYRPAQAAGASVTAPAGGHGAVLEGARAEPRHMTRVLPTGPPDDPFICATFGWAAQLCGTIYHAAAERAFDLAIGIAKWRAPNDNARPHIQWAIVGALLELEVISAHLAKLTGGSGWSASSPPNGARSKAPGTSPASPPSPPPAPRAPGPMNCGGCAAAGGQAHST